MSYTPVTFFWFRRDLRLDDNAGLYHALRAGNAVIPVFIFDTDILDKLENKADKRVQFIHQEICRINHELWEVGSSLLVKTGSPLQIWKELAEKYQVASVYTNHDYEPYAIHRDEQISTLLHEKGIALHSFKDQVVFEKDEVMKDDSTPYTVFTPYSKKWRAKLNPFHYKSYPTLKYIHHFLKVESHAIPTLEEVGFQADEFAFPPKIIRSEIISNYTEQRNFPALEGTSKLSVHLRFGTLSIRKLLAYALERNQTYVNELIWRDFYHQILWHFPYIVKGAFKKEYDQIEWENDETKFHAWCAGQTGFPLVDAGMRELNETGFMHNRVRMVVASFLTKHLLIDWKWGEAYFAEKLLDFDFAANNGGWQWAAGSGTDAAPYFRVFNPQLQLEKFDTEMKYVKMWVPEVGTDAYIKPIVEHREVKDKVMSAYGKALKR